MPCDATMSGVDKSFDTRSSRTQEEALPMKIDLERGSKRFSCNRLPATVTGLVIALLLIALWPVVSLAGGRVGGTTDVLRDKSGQIRGRGALPYKDQPPLDWHNEPVTLTPFCTLGAGTETDCVDGTRSCGEVDVACGPYIGGVEPWTAGIGLRNSPTGTLQLRGARPASQLVVAWLMWGVIIRDTPDDPTAPRGESISFAGVDLLGEELGESEEPCWQPGLPAAGEEVSTDDGEDPDDGDTPTVFRAFWVDVTAYLEPEINGDYPIFFPGSSLLLGEDPWGPEVPISPGFQADGASLVVVAAHPEIDPEAMVAFHTGPSFFTGVEEYHHELTLPLPPLSRVRHLRIGGDGQARTQLDPVSTFSTCLSPFDGLWVALRGDSSAIDPRPDWQGVDGGPITQLWDSQITDAWASELQFLPDQTSYRVRYQTALPPVGVQLRFDCVELMLHGLWVGNTF